MKYAEKLKDPRWQKLRLEVFNRDEFTCQNCMETEKPLAVHHLRYVPDREPWEYKTWQLVTLCEDCHTEEYESMYGAMTSLIEQIKDKGFLSNAVTNLSVAFHGLNLHYPQEVIADAISHIFTDDKLFSQLMTMYFKSIGEKNGKR